MSHGNVHGTYLIQITLIKIIHFAVYNNRFVICKIHFLRVKTMYVCDTGTLWFEAVKFSFFLTSAF